MSGMDECEGRGMVVNKIEKENHEKYLCKFRIAKGEETKMKASEKNQVKQSFVLFPFIYMLL